MENEESGIRVFTAAMKLKKKKSVFISLAF